MSSPIDPGDLVTNMKTSVESGVGGNLDTIGIVGGALLAVGVVWKLVRRVVKP